MARIDSGSSGSLQVLELSPNVPGSSVVGKHERDRADDDDDECAVCLDELNARPKVILPCNHAFHADCYVALVKSRVSQSQSEVQVQVHIQSSEIHNRGTQGTPSLHDTNSNTNSDTHSNMRSNTHDALTCPMCRLTLLHVPRHDPPRRTRSGLEADVYDEDAEEGPLATNSLTIVALCSTIGVFACLAWAVLSQGSYGDA